MSRSLIQTSNTSSQTVAAESVISLGAVLRRFGCNCRLNGNAIEIEGDGYYIVDVVATVIPDEAGEVTIALTQNDTVISGTTTTNTVAAVDTYTTLPIVTTVRLTCCNTMALKVLLVEGAGTVTNISARVYKV